MEEEKKEINNWKATFLLQETEEEFLILNSLTKKYLKIEKTHFTADTITSKEYELLKIKEGLSKTFECLLGVIRILGHPHLVVVKKSVLIHKFIEKEIFFIEEVELIGFYKNKISEQFKLEVEEAKYRLITMLSNGFYYSFGFDLSNKLLNQEKAVKNLNVKYDKGINPSKYFHKYSEINPYFFFNKNMIKPFLGCEDKIEVNSKTESFIMQWVPILLYGNIQILNLPCEIFNNKNITLLVISRRSCLSASKYTGKQGINEEGYVTNFIESEQILYSFSSKHKDYFINSFIQVSSTPPVFYTVNNENEILKLNKHSSSTKIPYKNFINNISHAYKKSLFINTLKNKNTDEKIILQNLEKVVYEGSSNFSNQAKYFYYNSEIDGQESMEKKDEFTFGLSESGILEKEILLEISSIASYFKHFQFDSMVASSTEKQVGVLYYFNIRTLMFIGFLKSIFGFNFLVSSLKSLGIKIEYEKSNKLKYLYSNGETDNDIIQFKKSYIEFGRRISKCLIINIFQCKI